jgi:hypothetical protein
MGLIKKIYWSAHSLKWKFVSHSSWIRSKINSFKWKLISSKNQVYWFFYKKPWFAYCQAAQKNYKSYWLPISNALSNRILRKKIIIVFLLFKAHYGWVDQVLHKLRSRKLTIQIFSPDEGLNIDPAIYKSYSMTELIPVKGVNFIPSLVADLYITPASTTADNAPLAAPKLMLMHSLVSIPGVYEENTFDGYDYIYCAGKHHLAELEVIYTEKGLTGKCLIPGGYPKLDELMVRAADLNPPAQKTIIIAPTLVSLATEHVSLMNQILPFIDYFLSNSWSVTFRPHPLNLSPTNVYCSKFNEIIKRYQNNQNFTLDTSSDYFTSYANASVMLSDISGTAYTYAFSFGRPVIFFDPDVPSDFKQGLLYNNRGKMGRSVRSIIDLQGCLNDFVENYADLKDSVETFRGDTIFNLGTSADYFAENLDYILNNKKHPDWTYV